MTSDPKAQDQIDRKTVATIVSTLACERFGHIYGMKVNDEVVQGFVSWMLESPEGSNIDVAVLKSSAADLCRFKAAAPKEWVKRKAWLNRPGKGPKMLKILIQITNEAKKEVAKRAQPVAAAPAHVTEEVAATVPAVEVPPTAPTETVAAASPTETKS